VGKQCIVVVVVCRNRCGNPYLPKGIAKESEVADTKGSTATGAPPLKGCVPSHNETKDQREMKGVV
jgi:hypothetical protein